MTGAAWHDGPRCRGPRRGRPRRPSPEPRLRQHRPPGRHLRHEPGDARPDRRRRDAVPRDGRGRSSSARSCRPAASSSGADGEMIGRTACLVVVIGTPVDEFLGPSMTIFEKAVDQIAPHLRDGALRRPAQHRLPGHDRVRGPAPRRTGLQVDLAFCPERIAEGHALEELHSLPQIVGADTDRAAERAARAVRHPRRRDDPDDDQGSRAGQALHQHLALHEVRGRQPVLHDRRPGRRGLHEHPAGDPRGLPAGRGPARARASPPGRACSRTPCSWPRSPPTTSRWARRRCRSTRACRRTSCRRSSAATAAWPARPSGSWAWPSRPNPTTRARR